MILVTGAAGFVGSTLIESLLARGEEVIGIDRFSNPNSFIKKRKNIASFYKNHNFTLVEMDLRNKEGIGNVFKQNKIDYIVHLGGETSIKHSINTPCTCMENNITTTTLLLDEARKANIKHFVFASTSGVYGQSKSTPYSETDITDFPLSPYSASKKACELIGYSFFNLYGLNFTALRFFNIYGPKGRCNMLPYLLIDAIKHDKEFTLYNGGQDSRDWINIEDIVSGIITSIFKPKGYQIFNLGCGVPITVAEVITIMEELLHKKVILKYSSKLASSTNISYANIDKAKQILGFSPRISFLDGISQFIEWYEKEVSLSEALS